MGRGAAVQATIRSNHETGAQSLRDLSAVRSFLVGPAIPPLLDAPWSPIFLASLFIFHPVLGLVGLSGALLLRRLRRKVIVSGAKRSLHSNTECELQKISVRPLTLVVEQLCDHSIRATVTGGSNTAGTVVLLGSDDSASSSIANSSSIGA